MDLSSPLASSLDQLPAPAVVRRPITARRRVLAPKTDCPSCERLAERIRTNLSEMGLVACDLTVHTLVVGCKVHYHEAVDGHGDSTEDESSSSEDTHDSECYSYRGGGKRKSDGDNF